MQKISVTEHSPLLAYLFRHGAPLTKTKIKQVLKYGAVRVNRCVVTAFDHPLKPGDTVEIMGKRAASTELLKTKMDFTIVHEDKDLIVVEKSAGLLTMGTDRDKEKTLYFRLTEYHKSRNPLGKGRIFIVHRLDRDASGLLVFAKSESSKRILQTNWNEATKKYYAITEGSPERKEGAISSYLEEDKFRRVYSVREPSREAKLSTTHYRVLRESESYALLDVLLETGRKNQIRVHLFDLGCPITGDAKYGAQSDPLHRLALHAYSLAFAHPTTGEPLVFQSKYPDSFKKIFDFIDR